MAPGRRQRRAALLLFAPVLVALLPYRYVVAPPTRFPARLGFKNLSANLDEFGKILVALSGQRPLLAAVLLLVFATLSCPANGGRDAYRSLSLPLVALPHSFRNKAALA